MSEKPMIFFKAAEQLRTKPEAGKRKEDTSWKKKSSFTARRVDRIQQEPGRLMVKPPFMWM